MARQEVALRLQITKLERTNHPPNNTAKQLPLQRAHANRPAGARGPAGGSSGA